MRACIRLAAVLAAAGGVGVGGFGVGGIGIAAARGAEAPADVLSALGLKTCRWVVPVVAPAVTGVPSRTSAITVTVDVGEAGALRMAAFALDPYPLRAEAFVVVVSDDAGEHAVAAPAASAYHGVDAASGDEMFATVVNGRVRATIIPARPATPLVYVQPAADAGAAGAAMDAMVHAVYASTDVMATGGECGLERCAECASHAAVTPSLVARGPGCKYTELTAECDFPYFQSLGSSYAACVQDVETVMMGVNALYRNTAGFTPQMRFALQRVVVRTTSASDPYSALPVPPTEADAGQLLTAERAYWNGQSATTPDLVHLFTGRDLAGSTVGLAYVDAVCGGFRYGLAQSRFTSNLAARNQDSAHEMGHNFSFSHDDSSGPNVMNSSINAGAPATTFSAQSVGEYTAHVGGYTCLNNAVPDALPDFASVLPGQSVVIDILANDGQGVICTAPVTTFALPNSTTALGGSVSRSVGTGPGGRDQVLYTPPTGVSGASDSFSYTAGSATVPVYVTIITPRAADQPYAAVTSGLSATYYDIRNPNGSVTLYTTMPDLTTFPVFGTGVVVQLNYPLTSGNAVGSSRTFAVGAIFRGFIQVPVTGFYQFWTVSDDLSRVTIGDTVVVTNGSVQTAGEATGTIALAPGRHALKVEYTNYANNTQLVLSYAYPGQARATVPASALWRVAGSCHADFNGTAGVTVQDIFDFLSAWFGGVPTADFNGVNGITVQDIFDFLGVWFGPC